MKSVLSRQEANYLMSRLARVNPSLPVRAPTFRHLVGKFAAACFILALQREKRLDRVARCVQREERMPEIDALHGLAGSGDPNGEDRGGYVWREMEFIAGASADASPDDDARGINWMHALHIQAKEINAFIFKVETNIRDFARARTFSYNRAQLEGSLHAALNECFWERSVSPARAARLMSQRLRVVRADHPDALPVHARFACDAIAHCVGRRAWTAEEVFVAIQDGAYVILDAVEGAATIAEMRGCVEKALFSCDLRRDIVAPLHNEGAPIGVTRSNRRDVIDRSDVKAELYVSRYADEREQRDAIAAFNAAIERGDEGWVVLGDVAVARIARSWQRRAE